MKRARPWFYKDKNPVSVIMSPVVFPTLKDELTEIEKRGKESRILVTGEKWLDWSHGRRSEILRSGNGLDFTTR